MLEPKDKAIRNAEDDLLMSLFASIESYRMYRHDFYLKQAASTIRRIRKLRKEGMERAEAGFRGMGEDDGE